uniref:30S ribosomal protein S7 n=1 Tax=uncultured marine group II/III euryarchaeote KM3_51_E06 TaxID=1456455 RepID=A0A075H8F4_9EURY|nr:ribosomal protein S7 (RP-S7, rpsG) [uncultured marine group II/III euryarchaeote KM3_51_E06]
MADDEITEQPAEDVPAAEQEDAADESPIAGIGTLVFGKWDASEVTCEDPGLAPYVNLQTVGVPHSGGRHANAWMGKSKLSVVERYINGLMRTGRNGGKKLYAAKSFEDALDIIHERTGDNPLQVMVDAITQSAPMEEITRIRFGAVSQPKAVDSAPSRRLDVAIRYLCQGAINATIKSEKTLTQGIVNEIMKAKDGDVASFAVSKKEEVQRIASSAR